MKLEKYLKDNIETIIIFIVVILLITYLLIMFNCSKFLIIIYLKKNIFYNNFLKHLTKLDKKYLVTEIIEKPNFIEGEIFYESLYDINKSFLEELNNYKYNSIEFKEYLELWCHEIKTPLATAKLIVENNKTKATNSINEEIEKVENYVEQVLYYAKSENVNEDYIISKTNIKSVIDSVIRKNKKIFLNNNIKVITIKDDIYVESDSKWLEFIINQIVINSIKYSNNEDSYIKINYKQNTNNTIITIEDNGIGIKKEELDKVFQKGFTGTNGRIKYNSTGIGLYLCQKLCQKLEISISITSELNTKTIVTLLFPNSSMINTIL